MMLMQQKQQLMASSMTVTVPMLLLTAAAASSHPQAAGRQEACSAHPLVRLVAAGGRVGRLGRLLVRLAQREVREGERVMLVLLASWGVLRTGDVG
jgi:hypothetical protein